MRRRRRRSFQWPRPPSVLAKGNFTKIARLLSTVESPNTLKGMKFNPFLPNVCVFVVVVDDDDIYRIRARLNTLQEETEEAENGECFDG